MHKSGPVAKRQHGPCGLPLLRLPRRLVKPDKVPQGPDLGPPLLHAGLQALSLANNEFSELPDGLAACSRCV